MTDGGTERRKPGAGKKLFSGPLIVLALAGYPAHAANAEGNWNATVSATTDYVLRGVSQTYDSGALQLAGSYQSQYGWFVGVWSSNVNPYPHGGASVELDLFAGLALPLGEDLSTRVAYTHYAYLDDPRPVSYAYDEVSASISYLDRLAATVSVQPDNSGYSALGYYRHEPTGALELTGRWPLGNGFFVGAGTGYYDLQRLFGVSYWAANLGAAYVYRHLTVQANHFFAENTVRQLYEEQTANGTWTLSATLHF